MQNKGMEKKFSICVPTFNRGSKALTVAQTLLPDIDDDWELLFLDNGSTKETESYAELAAMAEKDQRLRYICHAANRGFHRNFLACFEMANSPYIMLISDEDFANPEMIREVLGLLHEYPSVGVLRGAIEPVPGVKPRNSHNRQDASFMRGEEALMNYSFSNNYMSGVIYNRRLLMALGLLDKLEKGVDSNAIYPHLYLDLLACAVTDVVTTAQVCCLEGEAQIAEGNEPHKYEAPYSFGSRVDQFIVLRDAAWEAVGLVKQPFDIKMFIAVYLRLCEKYMFLITRVNSAMYLKNQIHPGILHQAMFYMCAAAISLYPEIAEFETYVFEELKKLHTKYEPYL